jgi:hypothetical protein
MNDLEIFFCIFAYITFGVLTDLVTVAPFIKEYNETKTNKIPLSLIIIILFIVLFTYPLLVIIVLVKLIINDLKKYFNLD